MTQLEVISQQWDYGERIKVQSVIYAIVYEGENVEIEHEP